MSKIAVAGTGYLGLVIGVCLAEIGHRVVFTDMDLKRDILTENGELHLCEADLLRLLKKNYEAGALEFKKEEKQKFHDIDTVFIGEHVNENPDGSPDVSSITGVISKLAELLEQDTLIVINSTVPVGTCDQLEEFMKDVLIHDVRVELAVNPQFFTKGAAIRGTFRADRIVIGTGSKWADEKLRKIYEKFQLPVLSLSRKGAELVKYAANNYLALKLSYMNELANLCELLGVDIDEVSRGMSSDHRIGDSYVNAGIGYGGNGFSSDTRALSYLAQSNGYELKTMKAATDVNHLQKVSLFRRACRKLISFHGMKVAVLGLTYKPGTNDCSDAPAIDNIELLLKNGAHIYAYDPVGIAQFQKMFPEGFIGNGSITYTEHIFEALDDAEACFIFTEWGKIKSIKPDMYRKLMKTPFVFDGRNIYQSEEMQAADVEYYSVGRKKPIRTYIMR